MNLQQPRLFSYNNLDNSALSLRFVRVLPKLRDGLICCDIFTGSPGTTKYTALSYVWGPEAPTHPILLRRRKKPRYGLFHIRDNLYKFLQNIRLLRNSNVFWIDAICIDQKNTSEKNAQVQRMGEIYLNADRVLVWLGDDPQINQLFLERIRMSSNDVRSTSSLSLAEGDAMSVEQYATIVKKTKYHEYWSRVWILQEFSLARILQFASGRFLLSFEQFWDRYRTAPVIPRPIHQAMVPIPIHEVVWPKPVPEEDEPPIHFFSVLDTRCCVQGARDGLYLTSYLPVYQNSQCTDNRDRVYALLAIIQHPGMTFSISRRKPRLSQQQDTNGRSTHTSSSEQASSPTPFKVDYAEDVHSLFCRAFFYFEVWKRPGGGRMLLSALRVSVPDVISHVRANIALACTTVTFKTSLGYTPLDYNISWLKEYRYDGPCSCGMRVSFDPVNTAATVAYVICLRSVGGTSIPGISHLVFEEVQDVSHRDEPVWECRSVCLDYDRRQHTVPATRRVLARDGNANHIRLLAQPLYVKDEEGLRHLSVVSMSLGNFATLLEAGCGSQY